MTGSSRLGLARPVRKPASSSLSDATDFCIRDFISSMEKVGGAAIWASSDLGRTDAGRSGLAGQDAHQTVFVIKGIDQYRQGVVPCKGEGGRVHDLEVPSYYFVIGDGLVARRLGVFLGIFRIDAVDFGALEKDVAFELDRF